jgi:hypothetical protein
VVLVLSSITFLGNPHRTLVQNVGNCV